MRLRFLLVSSAGLFITALVYFQLLSEDDRSALLATYAQYKTHDDQSEGDAAVFISNTTRPPSNLALDVAEPIPSLPDNLSDIHNETLGAQQVFMISMPTRRDKHDAFAVQALATNITYTPIDGVEGDQVPLKALPHTMDIKIAEVGCWRAHMNIFEEILDRKIATAIVFEDDADWDVVLKQQLVQFARGSRYVSGTEADETFVPHSPYGEDWDLLWLGQCSAAPLHDDKKRWVIPYDPTVLPPHQRTFWDAPEGGFWDAADAGDKTRVIFRARFGACTAAYAISLKGAEKAIYYLSMTANNAPIDIGMGLLCSDPTKNFNCVASHPTVVGISKPAGSSDRGSDAGHEPEEASVASEAHSERLMFSTRMNLHNLLTGNTTMKSAFPDHSPDRDIADLQLPDGYGYEFSTAQWQNFTAEKVAAEERKKAAQLQEQAAKLEEQTSKLEAEAAKLAVEKQELEAKEAERHAVEEAQRHAAEVPQMHAADQAAPSVDGLDASREGGETRGASHDGGVKPDPKAQAQHGPGISGVQHISDDTAAPTDASAHTGDHQPQQHHQHQHTHQHEPEP
ncbi:uncharacterized protein HMPREF1541_10511 [Cyphellophora europaea CBS 101466]|uniref:Glycosyl transferase family 25 domain-containing protein n=1 Tax=Cyphellophora europaea (strain CBS 101466) TaxID=1220924 RepID=W2S6K9_CYPE1|nr:uncharacterized protein HMPREF1541_10511 [Cyphellophora europaea CBS 101466]ETN44331.1 hypothetical protein HMPREF1541_10511 [Cyphellophora europaea CBS 101466]